MKVEKFQDYVLSLYNEHFPINNIRVPMGKPVITSPLIRKLKRAKYRAHRKNNPAWKALSAILKFHQQKELQKNTDNEINSATRGSKDWWNSIKRLTGGITTPVSSPVVSVNNNWITNAEFSGYYNSYHTNNNSVIEFPDYNITIDDIPSVEEYTVNSHLENIDTTKATISEDYPSWISKNNSHILSEPIAHIINKIFECGKFPLRWKRAEVVPINKVPDPSTYRDYRPISILHHLSKVAERILSWRIIEKLPTLKYQYAYTRNIGTTDALVNFSSSVASLLDCNDNLGVQAIMLDFSKAFDKMRPDLAVKKLLKLKIDGYLVAIVQDFLSNREQCVRFRNEKSIFSPINIGVPQGTVLGPLLWNAFIDDLSPPTPHLKYADDTTLYHPLSKSNCLITDSTAHRATVSISDNHLQRALDYTTQYCTDNFLLLNVNKTLSINFTLQKTLAIDTYNINHSEILYTPNVRLLGVIFDEHLKFHSHVDHIIDKTKHSLHGLIKLRKAGVRSHSLILFYKARILSVLSYAAPCWFPHTSQNDKDKLERFQKLCTRIMIPYEEEYEERLSLLKLEELTIHLDILCFRYIAKVKEHENHPCKTFLEARNHPSINRTAFIDNDIFHKYT